MKEIVRRQLGSAGYSIFRTKSMPYGLDPYLDIARICENWHLDVSVVFDVGANTGATALNAASRFPASTVWSFEPHPATFEVLRKSTEDEPRIRTFQLALGDVDRKRLLFVYEKSLVNSLTERAEHNAYFGYEPTAKIEVPSRRLDSFCAEHSVGKIDLLKIDTEGFDYNVLVGARTKLANGDIRFVYVEFNRISRTENIDGGNLDAIDELLVGMGFRYVVSYNDYVSFDDGSLFGVSNALYVLPASRR